MARYDAHLWIGLRTPDEFGILFTRTYGNGEAADDVASRRMGARRPLSCTVDRRSSHRLPKRRETMALRRQAANIG